MSFCKVLLAALLAGWPLAAMHRDGPVIPVAVEGWEMTPLTWSAHAAPSRGTPQGTAR